PSTTPNLQVWRLLLNGDLVPSAFMVQHFANNQLVLPRCITAFHGKVHFWGYVDYAQNCSTGSFEAAWVLGHDCDHFEHGPVSARPGSFHDLEWYVFAGPGSFSANLIPPPPASPPGRNQDFRPNHWFNLPNICVFEEPLSSATLTDGNTFCACGL